MVQTPDGETTRFLTHAIFSPSARPSPFASSSMLVPVLWWRPHTVKSSLACASLRQSRYASLVVWTCVAYAVFSLSLGAYGGGHWARIPSSWCLGFRINRFPVIDLGLLFPHVSGVDWYLDRRRRCDNCDQLKGRWRCIESEELAESFPADIAEINEAEWREDLTGAIMMLFRAAMFAVKGRSMWNSKGKKRAPVWKKKVRLQGSSETS